MMSCKETTEGIATDRFANAGFFTRLGLRFHLFMCRHCRRYAMQIRSLGDTTRCLCDDDPCLSPEARQSIVDSCLQAAAREEPAEPGSD